MNDEYELMEDLPFHDHYSIVYTDNIVEAIFHLIDYASKACPAGPIGIVRRDYSPYLHCVYGQRMSSR